MTDNLYALLQVDHNAPVDAIRKNFRKLAVLLHPDKGGDPAQFAALRTAYDTLADLFAAEGVRPSASVMVESILQLHRDAQV